MVVRKLKSFFLTWETEITYQLEKKCFIISKKSLCYFPTLEKGKQKEVVDGYNSEVKPFSS